MRRSGPPERKTPLSPGSKPLARKTPMPSGPGPNRKPPAQKQRTALPQQRRPTTPAPRPRQTGQSAEVRALVHARDLGRCQRCGAPATNQQHREGRGAGGRGKTDAERTNSPASLVSVCGQGNTSGCHRAIDEDRAAAEQDGYVIRRNGPKVDAALVPVRCYDGWHLLDHDGNRTPCDPPEGAT